MCSGPCSYDYGIPGRISPPLAVLEYHCACAFGLTAFEAVPTCSAPHLPLRVTNKLMQVTLPAHLSDELMGQDAAKNGPMMFTLTSLATGGASHHVILRTLRLWLVVVAAMWVNTHFGHE